MNFELWTDISYYQNGNAPGRPIDFVKMRATGAAGVCIRKSRGYYRDTWFERNWEGAGAAGLKRTFYSVPYVGYDFGRQWTAMTTLEDGSPFDPRGINCPAWCDVEYRHALGSATGIRLLLEWLQAMKEWAGAVDIYTAKFVWQDYYSRTKGWGDDWRLVVANYREGLYGLPLVEMIERIKQLAPACPIGWEYTKAGDFVNPADRWIGWQFAADGNGLGAHFGVHSRDIDLSLQKIDDDPRPSNEIGEWYESTEAALENLLEVFAGFPG